MSTNESELVRWIAETTPRGERVEVGIGDDAAVLEAGGGRIVVTADVVCEGVHFEPGDDPRLVGHKAAAVNLSDLAAMAALPRALLATLCVPLGKGEALREIHCGMVETAGRFGAAVVGGDLSASPGPIVVSVTAIGEAAPGGPCLRSGAAVGQAICVTGTLGGSRLGRHLRFTPRIEEARWLAQRAPIGAMVDLSDGLVRDLGNVLAASGGLGAVVRLGSVPVSEDARRQARRSGREALEHALCDGEDFELLFTVEPSEATRLVETFPFACGLSLVGEVRRCGMIADDGRDLTRWCGYEHRF